MNALVVYESMWGNTEAVAGAVAEGLGAAVALRAVTDAPRRVPDDVDLLVVGGPTHAFSMSRPATREDAVEQGARPGRAARGIREWLDALPASDHLDVATFDTRVTKVRRLPGSAARKAAREIRSHHLGHVVDTQSFYVEDVAGPLLDGELERARDWGRHLAAGSAVVGSS